MQSTRFFFIWVLLQSSNDLCSDKLQKKKWTEKNEEEEEEQR
jgi:hypothetical protein